MNVWQKARARGLSLPNICSYVCIRGHAWLSGLWGTARLRAKAALLGVELGANVRCWGPVLLARWPGSRITVGAGVSIISSSRRATACTLHAPTRLRTHGPEAHIELAEGVQLSGASITARSTRIYIGRNTLLAPNCVVVDSDFHAHWPPECRHLDPGYEKDAPVHIGDHVWLGMGCTVLKGVTIGEGAVIAAGSVVVRDVPPRTLAAGVPARVVRALEPEAPSDTARA